MIEFQKISFRDPSGFVILENEEVYRAIKKELTEDYKKLFSEKWYQQLVGSGKVQSSEWVNRKKFDTQFDWIEHPKFHFPLLPHEICAEQLYESALLTIEIAKTAFENGYILKDASAWNVVFDRGSPIFCDVTSFERYDGATLWRAYGQFCRHFIIPLLLYKYTQISPAQLFLSIRDGVPPAQARQILGYRAFFNWTAIETVYLPAYLERSPSQQAHHLRNRRDPITSATLLINVLNRLESQIKKLRPFDALGKSTWSDYEAERTHYSAQDLQEKKTFIKEALKLCPPSGRVLDLGCNQGEYSLLAADLHLNTVAVDFDEPALIKLQAKSQSRGISVGLLNICQPTPSIGWKNQDQRSFLDKASGHYDLVLCLGLVHHLLLTERIPLQEVCNLLAVLTKKYLLIEWIDFKDEKFQKISSFSQDLIPGLTDETFELVFRKEFITLCKHSLSDAKRTFYLLERLPTK